MNAGETLIDWLYREQLQVDAEWSQQTPGGFRCWPGNHMQTIEIVEAEAETDGPDVYVVSIRTELLKDVSLEERPPVAINQLLMSFAALAGPVYDAETRTLSLCSAVRVHDEVLDWSQRIACTAATMQVHEASVMKPELAAALGGRLAISHHPYSGPRPKPDDLMEVVPKVVVPMGEAPANTKAKEFRDVAKQLAQVSFGANADHAALTAEFPFGGTTSLCRFFATADSRYGNGLALQQFFRVPDAPEADGIGLALALNELELSKSPLGYGLGSYFYEPGVLGFRSFFPNIICRPGLLANLFMSCRARSEILFHQMAAGRPQ